MSTGHDLLTLPLAAAAQLLARRQVSPVELVEAALDRSAAVQPHLNCYLDLYADQALAAARRAEGGVAAGQALGPLHGIPYAPKDIFTEPGVRCTAGSRILAAWIPAVKRRCWRAYGRRRHQDRPDNLHEFAYGITNVNPHYGPVHNPWQHDHVTGGSSGGSAAAVAAGAAGFSLGTDTGGSVRLPAALCGIVGLKPTYGRVSRTGLLPLAWSLDHVGPMTRTVADAAVVLEAIAGHDPSDATSSRTPVPAYVAGLDGNLSGLRLGVPQDDGWDEVNPEIRDLVQAAVSTLRSLGPSVEPVSLPASMISASPSTRSFAPKPPPFTSSGCARAPTNTETTCASAWSWAWRSPRPPTYRPARAHGHRRAHARRVGARRPPRTPRGPGAGPQN